MLADRKSRLLAIALLCIVAIACFGTLYLVGDLARFQEADALSESRMALDGVNDPERLDQVLEQHPFNRVLKLVALANRDSVEMDGATRGLLSEAEPAELWKRMEKELSTRADLEALGRDLKAAESNAADLGPSYDELGKIERNRVEHDAMALEGRNETLARFMAMIDEQHAGLKAVLSKISASRLAYYRAYEKCVALLAGEFGVTKVVNGQFIFRLQSQADSYNDAAAAMAAAAKRLAELETGRASLRQSQLHDWKNFVGH